MEKETLKAAPVMPKQDSEETVTLKRGDFEDLMQRLKRVEYAADKSHLATFDGRNTVATRKKIPFRALDGKIIMSWDKLKKNIVEKNVHGAWYEDQLTTLHFEDGTELDIGYSLFSRNFERVEAELVSETVKEDGERYFELETPDGVRRTFNATFVH